MNESKQYTNPFTPVTPEHRERHEFALPTDRNTVQSLCRIAQKNTELGKIAKLVFTALRTRRAEWEEEDRAPASFELPTAVATKLTPETWNALQYELEDERILLGEITPRVKEFMDSRKQLQQSLRTQREQLQTESINASEELMTTHEKQDSRLFEEADAIVKNIAREFGFTRPIITEISRNAQFNAFVLSVSKEGGMEQGNVVPLRVFINAGLISEAQKMLEKNGKELTRAHLAFVIGHELQHLRQPGYDMDQPPQDKEQLQRYEYDADAMSLEMMDRAGYNPLEGIDMMKLLQQNIGKELISHYASQTHPVTENRIKELWRIYQRSDRPFFSSQKEPEPLPADVLVEAENLIRRELKKELEDAVTLEHWDHIIQRLEHDPTATLKDAELIGIELKKHLDVRASISGALRAMRTESALARAYVFKVNRTIIEANNPPAPQTASRTLADPWAYAEERASGYNGSSISGFVTPVFKKLLAANELSEDAYDPRQTREVDEQKVEKFIEEHSAGDEVQTNPSFHSMQELLDPKNPVTVKYWQERTKLTNLNDEQLMAHARQTVIEKLSTTICVGFSSEARYFGDQVEQKKIFLDALEAARAEMKTTSSDQPQTSAISFDRALEGLSQRVSQRLAGYHAPSTLTNIPTGEPPKMKTYELKVELLNHPLRIPEQAFEGKIVDTVDMVPIQKILTRYVQSTRHILGKTLAPQNMQQRFGQTLPDDVEARSILMNQLFRQFLFGDEPALSAVHVKEMSKDKPLVSQHLVESLRYIPSYIIQNYRDTQATNRSGLLQFFGELVCKDERKLRTPQGAMQALEDARVFAHQPRLKEMIHPKELFDLKHAAFTAMLNFGLESLKKTAKNPAQEILQARAKAKGLPADFASMHSTVVGVWEKARIMLGSKPAAVNASIPADTLKQIFTAEFMRLFADTEEEMELCSQMPIVLKLGS